jgi:hypothetical protein
MRSSARKFVEGIFYDLLPELAISMEIGANMGGVSRTVQNRFKTAFHAFQAAGNSH